MNKKVLKSVGAVLAGFVTVFVLSTVTDLVLEKLGVNLSQNLLLALIYRTVYTVFGGYVTAVLAPNRPMRHVIILGIMGLAAGTLGAIAGWNLSAHWYPIALAVLAFPSVWLGGKLKVK